MQKLQLFFSALLTILFTVSLISQSAIVIHGEIVTSNAEPVPGIEVSLWFDNTVDSVAFTTVTDEDGNFTFEFEYSSSTGDQPCAQIGFADCDGNFKFETVCWSPNQQELIIDFVYCQNIIDGCGVAIEPFFLGGIPLFLFADGFGVGDLVYSWSDGSVGPEILITSPGEYCVTLTDANGCVADACYVVDPTIFGCYVEIHFTDEGLTAVTNGIEPVSFLWNTGDTTQSVQPIDYGHFCVTATDSLGCVAEACIDFNTDNCWVEFLCDPFPNGIQLFAQAGGIEPLTYLWNTGDTTQSILVVESGLYCVTVTDAIGCMAELCQEIDLDWTQDSCYVFILDVTEPGIDGYHLTAISNLGPNALYQWSNGEQGIDIYVADPGTYCVEVSSFVCAVDACIVVGDSTDCHVEILPTTSGLVAIATGTAPFLYEWNTGDTTADIPAVPGELYIVTVVDANGCVAVAEYIIDNSFCEVYISLEQAASGYYLVAHGAGVEPFEFYWENGQAGQEIQILESGEYCVVMTDAAGCSVTSCIYAEIENEGDCFGYIQAVIYEEGKSAELVAITDGVSTQPYEYYWNTGETGRSIKVDRSGFYCVTIANPQGCTYTTCIDLILVNDEYECAVEIKPLDTNVPRLKAFTDGEKPIQYLWNTGDTSETIIVLENGWYCVTIEDAKGCAADDCYYYPPTEPDSLGSIYGPVLPGNADGIAINGFAVLYQLDSDAFIKIVDTTEIYPTGTTPTSYLFTGLKSGSYIVKAFITSPENVYLPTYHLSAEFWQDADVIEVRHQRVEAPIELIRLDPNTDEDDDGIISGTVTGDINFKADSEEVKSVDDPLENVEIILKSDEGRILAYRMTDHEGRFSFENLSPGVYEVYLEIPGVPKTMRVVVLSSPGETQQIGFQIGDDGSVLSTSLVEFEEPESFLLFPSPATKFLNIDFNSPLKEKWNVEIYSLSGKSTIPSMVLDKGLERFEINIANLNPGMYFLYIKNDKTYFSQPFIKQ